MTLLRAEALTVGYAGRALLPPLTFTVAPGEFWVIIGQNGSGKSTLLRTLLGFLPPVGGVLSRGVDTLGYVPQRHEVDTAVPTRVIDLVRGGAERGLSFLSPWHPWRSRAAVHRALEVTRTQALQHRPFNELSEGQKQRALLARALVGDPALLVLDEPTSAMDLVAERDMFSLLDELRRSRTLGIVLVLHHLMMVAERATHAVLLDKDQGLALAGTFDAVTTHAAFIERYGFLVHDSPLTKTIQRSAQEEPT